MAEAIEDERNDETEQSNSTNKSTERTMSAIAIVETVPTPDLTTVSSHHSSNAASEVTSQSSMNAIAVAEPVPSLGPSEFVPALHPTSTFSDRSSYQDDTEPDSESTSWLPSTRRTRSSVASPARSSSSST